MSWPGTRDTLWHANLWACKPENSQGGAGCAPQQPVRLRRGPGGKEGLEAYAGHVVDQRQQQPHRKLILLPPHLTVQIPASRSQVQRIDVLPEPKPTPTPKP